MRDLIKKILKEESEFDWIKDITPRGDDEIKVGDYFYILDDYPGQNRTLSNAPKGVRYLMKIVEIEEVDGEVMVSHPTIDIKTFYEEEGAEEFYSDEGEYYGDENNIPYITDLDPDLDLVTLDTAKKLIRDKYWRHTDNPMGVLKQVYGENYIFESTDDFGWMKDLGGGTVESFKKLPNGFREYFKVGDRVYLTGQLWLDEFKEESIIELDEEPFEVIGLNSGQLKVKPYDSRMTNSVKWFRYLGTDNYIVLGSVQNDDPLKIEKG